MISWMSRRAIRCLSRIALLGASQTLERSVASDSSVSSIDAPRSRRDVLAGLPSAFDLGDPLKRVVPPRFELCGHQTVVGVHGFVAAGREGGLVLGLLELQPQRAVLVVLVLLSEIARFDRGRQRTALHHGEDLGAGSSRPDVGH